MTGTAERGALVRRIATFAALGTFVIVVASAFLRLSAPHQDCLDWPACYGKVTQTADGTEPSAARRVARLAHRIAATAVTAAIVALAVLCFTQRPVGSVGTALELRRAAMEQVTRAPGSRGSPHRPPPRV